MTTIKVQPLGYALGAAILGLDLRKPIRTKDRDAIYRAWLKHLILVFPGQNLEPEELIRFSGNFGDLDQHDSIPHYRDSEHHEIVLVTNVPRNGRPSETRNTGRNWHSDLTFTRRPAKGALLLCKQRPPVGGDTIFANLYLAYESLSPVYREFLEKLEAVHDVTLIKGIEQRDSAKVQEMRLKNPPVAHPVVPVHPESGRKSLLAGERVRRFVGMTEEESAPILAYLNAQASLPEFTYRHSWSVGDIVMWDNRCTQHLALPDFDQSQYRHMLRCTLLGEETGMTIGDEAPVDGGDLNKILLAVA